MHCESPTRRTASRYSATRNLHRASFFCHAPGAIRVSVVGDFNHWDPNANPMTRQADGGWTASLELGHGYHPYAFLVDGRRVLDPKASGTTRDSQDRSVSLVGIS